jgi:hypothetical protein
MVNYIRISAKDGFGETLITEAARKIASFKN